MRFDVLTLFPDLIGQALSHSIVGRAIAEGRLEVVTTNPRDFANDKHRTVDDSPYGGGPGMVLMAPPIEAALASLSLPDCPVILMDPAAPLFRQSDAHELAQMARVVVVCGHYEGTDERVRTQLCDRAYSIGDYVLTGGELPALVMVDAIARLLPGVLGHPESFEDDSYEHGLLGHPVYTKPQVFREEAVPPVLLSGDHRKIDEWRRRQRLLRTRNLRPDLFVGAQLTPEDVDLLG